MKLHSFVLSAIIMLAACGPTGPGTPETSPSATSSPGFPSPTVQPSITPTAPPAFTPTPGVSPLLPLLEADCFTDYPATIELPAGDAQAYRLKPWSQEAAFEFIRTIDQNSPPCGEYWTGAEPVFSTQNARRRAGQLAVAEAILRDPDGPNRDLLDWRLAVNHAILGNPASDHWLLDQIRKALQSGRATPETLAGFVQLYSFEILQVEPANNLFADGETAYVYWLSVYTGRGNGMYFALRVNQDKTYTVYPLLSSWDINMGTAGGFSIEDHTKDGIPEIVVLRSFRNGSSCWEVLNIYQWHTDRFQDLTVQGLRSGSGGCETYFDKPDSQGFDTIHTLISTFGGSHSDTHAWNGSFYELADKEVFWQAESDWALHTQIRMLNEQGKFLETETRIQEALANFQELYIAPDLKYDFRDYLQFQRGWVQALEMNVTETKEILQALAASPAEPGNVTVARAAQDFLDTYSTDLDLYRACQAANQRMAQYTVSPICDLPTALVFLSRDWTVDQYNDPFPTLEEYGVQIVSSAQVDADGDGRQDWIFSVKKPGQGFVDLYVLRAAGSESSLAYLTEADTLLAPFEVRAVTLSGNERPTVFLQSGQLFYSFQVVPGKQRLNLYITQTFPDVRSVELSKDDREPFEFKINYFPGEYIPDWETYRWDPTFQRFLMSDEHRSIAQSQWEGPVDPARQAESKLFSDGEPAEAIRSIEQVLAIPEASVEGGCWMPGNCMDRSRLRYLLALSYELTGEEAKAVQIYWQLWHDDPGSPYAVLARAKLEPQN